MANPNLESSQAEAATSYQTSEFASLLKKEFKPKSSESEQAIESAVKTLAGQALENAQLISDNTLDSITSIIGKLDQKLTEQINLILHHDDYQKLESAWRGLSYLVNNTETDEMLKIRVLNISKNDLNKTLKKFKGTAWDQRPIFKQIYEAEYGQFGGEPYGWLVGGHLFMHHSQDICLTHGNK